MYVHVDRFNLAAGSGTGHQEPAVLAASTSASSARARRGSSARACSRGSMASAGAPARSRAIPSRS